MRIYRGGQLTLAAFFVASAFGQVILDLGVKPVDDFCTGGDRWTVTAPVPPTVTDKTLRFGTFLCRVPVPDGYYIVTLKFLEPNQTAVGARVFSVTANDLLVVNRLDLVAVAGSLTPYERTFQVDSRVGFIDLSFFFQTRSAVVSSIYIASRVDVGPGIVSTVLNGRQKISVDTAWLLHIWKTPGDPLPVAGEGCNDAGAVSILPDAVYFCAPVLPLSADPNPWGRWVRLQVAQPVASHPSGLKRIDVAGQPYVAIPATPAMLAAPGWVTQ